MFSLFLVKKKNTGQANQDTGLDQIEVFFKKISETNDNDSLKILAGEFEKIVENRPDSVKSGYYSQLGVLFYRHSLLNEAAKAFSKSRGYFMKTGDSSNVMHMLMNEAAMKEMSGNYDTAVSIYLKVIEYFKNKKDSLQLANGYSNLGVAYEEMEQARKSIEYHKKALQLRLKIKDTLNTAYSYNNIGVVYTELLNNSDSALVFYKKAAAIFKILNAQMQYATVMNNIGHIYLNKKDYTNAGKYFSYPLRLYDSLNILQGKAEVLRSFGQLYFAQGKDNEAIDALKKSIGINKTLNIQKEILETEKILAKIYMAKGNYALAAKTMQYYNRLNDSILNMEKQKTIADMETKYQVKEKNKTIKVLRLEDELHRKQIKYQTIFIILLVIIFVLIVVVFYYYRKRLKSHQKELRLEIQNYLLQMSELRDEIKEKGDCAKFSKDKLKKFDLSDREIEVLNLIAKGYKNSEIAEKLFVSQNTVKSHIKNIYVKLDVKNRVEAVKRFDAD